MNGIQVLNSGGAVVGEWMPPPPDAIDSGSSIVLHGPGKKIQATLSSGGLSLLRDRSEEVYLGLLDDYGLHMLGRKEDGSVNVDAEGVTLFDRKGSRRAILGKFRDEEAAIVLLGPEEGVKFLEPK